MKIGIIGLGLIGGSMAIDLKKREFASKIIGYDAEKIHAETALHIGFIDKIEPLEETVKQSDIVILAIPAGATAKILEKVLDLTENQIVTDVCSVKKNVAQIIDNHKKRENYVAAHPMAGTEFTGPWAAKSGLFDGKAIIICDKEKSSEKAVNKVLKLYEYLNMNPVFMNSHDHDIHAAYVSHISHISSFALALTVLEKEKNDKNIFNLASGGFDSTVRLAKSSASMWSPIFEYNSENVITVLETYISNLKKFKKSIEEKNITEIEKLILDANKIKRIL